MESVHLPPAGAGLAQVGSREKPHAQGKARAVGINLPCPLLLLRHLVNCLIPANSTLLISAM